MSIRNILKKYWWVFPVIIIVLCAIIVPIVVSSSSRSSIVWVNVPLDDATVAYGDMYSTQFIVDQDDVQLSITEGPDWLSIVGDELRGRAPFTGNFEDTTYNISISADYAGESATEHRIEHTFTLTAHFPNAIPQEWDAKSKSANVRIAGNRVDKDKSGTIDWVYAREPLPSTLEAAIINFTIHNPGEGLSFANVVGLDLIGTVSPTRQLSSAGSGEANALITGSSNRYGVVFRQGSSNSILQLNVERRSLDKLDGQAGDYIDVTAAEGHQQSVDTFSEANVSFYIYNGQVTDIKVKGISLSNFDGYNLQNFNDNQWYVTVRDPRTNQGLFDVSASVAMINSVDE